MGKWKISHPNSVQLKFFRFSLHAFYFRRYAKLYLSSTSSTLTTIMCFDESESEIIIFVGNLTKNRLWYDVRRHDN